MEYKTISEFETGKRAEGFYMIKSVDCKITNSNNKKYLDFILGDKTGDINAKLWECSSEEESMYSENMLVKVRGTVIMWQNSNQLKIEKIRKTVPEDEIKIEDFVACAPYESEFMFSEILKYMSKIKNKDIYSIVNNIIEKNKEKIIYYPAAKKNHHSIRGGLLYHTWTMLRMGEKVSEIYDFLNTDLLFGGIILHDIAKVYEMDSSEFGIVSDYSVEGQLLGHITIGVKLVEVSAREVGADEQTAMLLEHMILSHHYEPEYGSPVKPMFPEAEILHYLDIIDARMYDMHKAVNETKPGEFSDRIWSLENRKVYNYQL